MAWAFVAPMSQLSLGCIDSTHLEHLDWDVANGKAAKPIKISAANLAKSGPTSDKPVEEDAVAAMGILATDAAANQVAAAGISAAARALQEALRELEAADRSVISATAERIAAVDRAAEARKAAQVPVDLQLIKPETDEKHNLLDESHNQEHFEMPIDAERVVLLEARLNLLDAADANSLINVPTIDFNIDTKPLAAAEMTHSADTIHSTETIHSTPLPTYKPELFANPHVPFLQLEAWDPAVYQCSAPPPVLQDSGHTDVRDRRNKRAAAVVSADTRVLETSITPERSALNKSGYRGVDTLPRYPQLQHTF